jgi:hypothetical protein
MDSEDEEDLRIKMMGNGELVDKIERAFRDKDTDVIDQIEILMTGAVVKARRAQVPWEEFKCYTYDLWHRSHRYMDELDRDSTIN